MENKTSPETDIGILTSILDNAPLGAILFNQKKQIIYASSKAASMLELTKNDLMNTNILKETFHEESLKKIHSALSEALESNQPVNLIIECPIKQKKYNRISLEFKAIRNNSNTLTTCYLAPCETFSQVNYHSSIHFKSLVENSQDVLWIINQKFQTIYVSPSIEKLTGFTVEEHLKQTINERFSEESVERIKKSYLIQFQIFKKSQNKKNHSFFGEFEYKHKNGRTVWAELNVYPLLDNNENIIGIQGSSRDITQRRLNEKRLRTGEEKFKKISEIASDYAYSLLVNKDGNITCEWSFGAFQKISGYNPIKIWEEGDIEKLIHPDDHLKLEDRIKRQLSGESVVSEMRIVTKSGEIKWIQDKGMPEWCNKENRVIRIIGTASDITQRKEAEQALKESQKRLSLAIEGANIGVWAHDFKKNTIYRSANWAKMLGYKPEEIENKVSFWKNLIHPEDIPTTEETARMHESGHIPEFRVEHRMKTKEGRWKWILNWGKVLERDKNQEPVIAFGIHMDIDFQKKAELIIKESEQRYKVLANATEEAIFVTENEICTNTNDRASQLFGYSKTEIIGKPSINFIAYNYRNFVHKNLTVEAKNQFEAIALRKDGTEFPAAFHTKMYYNKGKKTWLTTCRNLTNQKKNEKLLIEAKENAEKNETKYKELAALLPETVFEVNDKNEIIFLNKSGCKKIGLKENEFKKNIPFIELIAPCDRKRLIDSIEKIKEGKLISGNEYSIIKPDGTTFPAIIYNTPVFENNELVGFRGLLIDITELKNSEKLKNEIKVAEKTAKVKQQFIANMSHEMRTPMTGIIGMTEFLLETNLSEKQKEYTSIIKDSSESLLYLINDILDLSKIEQKKMQLYPENTNIIQLLNNTINMFRGLAKQKQIEIFLDIDKNFPENILIDPNRLKQIISNLISNAVKYTKSGEIKATLDLISKNKNSIQGKFSIEDTGIGISERDQKKIFNNFSRLDEGYARNTEGTGLGLPIAKNLVELMNGKLELQSELGKGSTFWFTFSSSINKESKSNIGCSADPKQILMNIKPKVLFAEDKLVNRKVIGMMLENIGCKVDLAINGLEVIEKFSEFKYDLIILDIMMPEMNGIEALLKLKETYTNLPPIIGLSANAMEGDAEKYINMGMDDYLAKPVKSSVLYAKLAEHLN